MRFKSILNEQNINLNINNLKEITKKYLTKLHSQWRSEFPEIDKLEDLSYMEPEFDRSFGGELPLLFDMVSKGHIQTNVTMPKKPYYSFKHGCFYNSLAYAKMHPEVDLAFGGIIEKGSLKKAADWITDNGTMQRPFMMNITLHSFCIDKKSKKVIDPTFKRADAGNYYIYELVPRGVVDKLKIKENDKNFDARSYADIYIENKYKTYRLKFNFKKFINS